MKTMLRVFQLFYPSSTRALAKSRLQSTLIFNLSMCHDNMVLYLSNFYRELFFKKLHKQDEGVILNRLSLSFTF